MEGSDLANVILESKYPEYQLAVKGPLQVEWIDGFPVQAPKHIMLSFSRFICILSDEFERMELTDEDKDFVARALTRTLADPSQTDFWQHLKARPGKPWPTYDETDARSIPATAQAVGMIAEALTYEREGRVGGPREAVVKKLESLLNDEPGAAVNEDDFAAV